MKLVVTTVIALALAPSLPAFQADGEVHRTGGGVSAPSLIHKVELEYTAEAKAAKVALRISKPCDHLIRV